MDSQEPIALTQLKSKRRYAKRHSLFKSKNISADRTAETPPDYEPAKTTADSENSRIKRQEGAHKRRMMEKDHSSEWQYSKHGWDTAQRKRNYPKITTFFKVTKEQLTLEELKEELLEDPSSILIGPEKP